MPATDRPRWSLAKKLRFAAILFLLFFTGLEAAARVGSYFYHGRNPYYLLYGLRSWSNEEGEGHTVVVKRKSAAEKNSKAGMPHVIRVELAKKVAGNQWFEVVQSRLFEDGG